MFLSFHKTIKQPWSGVVKGDSICIRIVQVLNRIEKQQEGIEKIICEGDTCPSRFHSKYVNPGARGRKIPSTKKKVEARLIKWCRHQWKI